MPRERQLAESGSLSVWLTSQAATPTVVEEIGRLRETTFRNAGEGTGRATDLDRFDSYYLHLFVWNDRAGHVVAAYRLASTEEILARMGPDGLYTSTLFRLGSEFIRLTNPALELGRSFVRQEYQRDFAPLMLLWKGIGCVVASRPSHARLFGAVSISREYAALSRQLLVTFLEAFRLRAQRAGMVKPRRPPRRTSPLPPLPDVARVVGGDVDRLDELIRDVERGRRGVPVLLRQYLRLNARLIDFNVDAGFNDALDALMVVDLRSTDRAILTRYLGRSGAQRFLAFHGLAAPSGLALGSQA
jgi:hypothetical protein